MGILPRVQFLALSEWDAGFVEFEAMRLSKPQEYDFSQDTLDEIYFELLPIIEVAKFACSTDASVKWIGGNETHDGEICQHGKVRRVEVTNAWTDEYGLTRRLEEKYLKDHGSVFAISPETAKKLGPPADLGRRARSKERNAAFGNRQCCPSMELRNPEETIALIHERVDAKVGQNKPEHHNAWLIVVATQHHIDELYAKRFEAIAHNTPLEFGSFERIFVVLAGANQRRTIEIIGK